MFSQSGLWNVRNKAFFVYAASCTWESKAMQEGHGFREMRRRISRCASAVHDGGGERLRGLSVGASELLRREYVFFLL